MSAMTSMYSTIKKKAARTKWAGTLAGDTFQTLLPYIDVFGCGEWYQGAPHFSIPNEIKNQYATRFAFDNPGDIAKKYHAGRLTPRRIQRGIERDDQYFTCNKASASGRSLVYLDLDDHLPHQSDKAQLTQAVLNFVGADNLFFNEGRLWLKGDWVDSDYPQFKKVYATFASALGYWAVANGFDTNVDSPKGFNQLGRLPLKNWKYDKLNVFVKTPHITVEVLKEWTRRLNVATAEIEVPVPTESADLTDMLRPTINQGATPSESADCGDVPLRTATHPKPQHPACERPASTDMAKPKLNVCRSLAGLPLTEDEITDIHAKIKRYRNLSYRCMQVADKHKPDGQRLYSLDVQYALTILDFHFKYANDNHCAPVNRAAAWWKWMVKEGHFTRGWCGKKWAAIYRMLVDCGVLNVIDNQYWFYAGEKRTGKPMQYHMKEEYLAVAPERGEAPIQEVKIDYVPRRCRPCLVSPPERRPDHWFGPRWWQILDERLYEIAA